jgi:hypothetical protein
VKSSLIELDQTRKSLDSDNVELRTFLGELGDWVERLLEEERELYSTGTSQADGEEEEEEEIVDPDREEARKLMERLNQSEQDHVCPGSPLYLSRSVFTR